MFGRSVRPPSPQVGDVVKRRLKRVAESTQCRRSFLASKPINKNVAVKAGLSLAVSGDFETDHDGADFMP